MYIKVLAKNVNGKFTKKVEELSGQNILKCYQCGKCSGGCPMIEDMDLLPNQVIRYVQLGEEAILDSKTIWLCASCFTCAVRCPKGVDLAKVMEALRLIVLRKNFDYIKLNAIQDIGKLPQIALISSFRKMTS
ncbi:MAG: 4Fe-4S dicluster domain-containing protein [Candidatus Thermoplasmatota archaeon]